MGKNIEFKAVVHRVGIDDDGEVKLTFRVSAKHMHAALMCGALTGKVLTVEITGMEDPRTWESKEPKAAGKVEIP